MPPALAARFTVGELAVLRIVGDEVRARKVCGLHLDAIAARTGVSRSTAKNAIREAKRLGLVEVQERRRHGAKGPDGVDAPDGISVPEWWC
jgi:ribosomal protein S25